MSRSLVPMLAWLALSACTYASGDPRVLVTSTPAGAEILVDGQETGRTTPSMIDLDGIVGSDHLISLRKPGFDAEHRDVVHYSHWYTSRWIDGTDFRLFALPIWWTLGDFFTPFAVKWQYVPHELHVKLYPEGEAPVHADRDPDGLGGDPADHDGEIAGGDPR